MLVLHDPEVSLLLSMVQHAFFCLKDGVIVPLEFFCGYGSKFGTPNGGCL